MLADYGITVGGVAGGNMLDDAIVAANANGGHDTIWILNETYNITNITLPSDLETITEGLTIRTESEGEVVLSGGWGPGIVVDITVDHGSGDEDDVAFYDLRVVCTGTAFTLGGDELKNFSLVDCTADKSPGLTASTNETVGVDIQLGVNADYGVIYNSHLKNKEDGVRLKGHVDLLQIIDNDIWAMRTDETHDPGNPETEPNGIELVGTGTVHIGGNEIYYIGGTGALPWHPDTYTASGNCGNGIYIDGHSSSDLKVSVGTIMTKDTNEEFTIEVDHPNHIGFTFNGDAIFRADNRGQWDTGRECAWNRGGARFNSRQQSSIQSRLRRIVAGDATMLM